jgi:septal ring factor EnvC (AmiA/AmiB activator)
MWRRSSLALTLLVASGCAITNRLDATNSQLTTANAQLARSDQRVADMQAHIQQMAQQLAETDRKLNTVEQAVLQSPVLRPRISPAPPTEPIPAPNLPSPAPAPR